MGTLREGMCRPRLVRDTEGHRQYEVSFKVLGAEGEGPYSILYNTPGLPQPGQFWNFDSDIDPWAWCLPDATVEPFVEDEAVWWWVRVTFSTKPPDRNVRRCNDTQVEDPLLEPAKIDFNARNERRAATEDRYGVLIKNSAHELLRGANLEFDEASLTVKIQQNVQLYNVAFNRSFMNKLNDRVLYGCAPRTIRVVNVDAQERYFGLCYKYYSRTIELEFREEGFDRVIRDEGTMALNGTWNKTTREWVLNNIDGAAPDPKNPLHFIRLLDNKGNPIKMILDGAGKPFKPQLTDKCTDCSDVTAPQELEIFGLFDLSNEGFELDSPITTTSTITHSGVIGECEWTGAANGLGPAGLATFRLRFDAGTWRLEALGADNLVQHSWSATTWTCTGPLLMTRDGNAKIPKNVTLLDANQAGSISVEKYYEANLFLLGLPAFLGT